MSVLVATGANAQEQELDVQYEAPPTIRIEPLPEKSTTFESTFKHAFDDRIEDLLGDRLHPLRVLGPSLRSDTDRERDLHEETSRITRDAVFSSAVYGLREATFELPVLTWLKDRQGVLAEFLRNSIGNVAEESVMPVEASYSEQERSWWKSLRESGNMKYGIRPLRADPYAFVSMAIRNDERTLLLSHLRYHYRIMAEHRAELAVSIPMKNGFSLDAGTSYSFGEGEERQKVVVKLFKEFSTHGIMHLGLELRDRPVLISGMAFSW